MQWTAGKDLDLRAKAEYGQLTEATTEGAPMRAVGSVSAATDRLSVSSFGAQSQCSLRPDQV